MVSYSVLGPCTVLLNSHLIPGQDGEEEAEVAEDGQSEQVAAKQIKKRPQKKTVEQNLSNINLSESEMKCEVNNMTEKTSQIYLYGTSHNTLFQSSFIKNCDIHVYDVLIFFIPHNCIQHIRAG